MSKMLQRIGSIVGSKNEKETSKSNKDDVAYCSDDNSIMHSIKPAADQGKSFNETFLQFPGSVRKIGRSWSARDESFRGKGLKESATNDLASFDICIEAIDSLAAHSHSTSRKIDQDRGIDDVGKEELNVSDSYVRISADGILLHVPGDLIMTSK